MDEAIKEALRNHWIPRVLRVTREAYVATSRRDPMYLILDAACLATPLWPDEPYFQRPTPAKQVGGVVRYIAGTKDKALFTNVFDPVRKTVVLIRVCEVAELVDNLGRVIEAAELSSEEADQFIDKVRRWITHDDSTDDDTPDAVSLKLTAAARAPEA